MAEENNVLSEQDLKDEADFAAYIEEGKKKFGCILQIEQTATLVKAGQDGDIPVMTSGLKSVLMIRKVKEPKPEIAIPTEGEVLDFQRHKNGG